MIGITGPQNLYSRKGTMEPHAHISPVHGLAMCLFVLAVFGTLHLLALSHDNRASRALIALGF